MRKATRVMVSSFGALVGLAGIEHGIGEVLQGNLAPGGIMILSWPDSAFFRILNGEPAMTVIPNLLATGILALIFSLSYLVCAVLFAERKRCGLVLTLLSLAMLWRPTFPACAGCLIGCGHGPLVPRCLPGWR